MALLPVAIGIAVLRYRLYEIDRIISRTLAWAMVTGLLLAAFVVLVIGLTALLQPVTGGNTFAVAGSTLVVFVLFQPLRTRIQGAVDRRFDRYGYDAERTAAAFATRLRDDVDLALGPGRSAGGRGREPAADDHRHLDAPGRRAVDPVTTPAMARGRLTGGPSWLVWGVVAVELGYVALSVVVAPDSVEMPTFARLIFALLVASLGIVGAPIATRQPRNTVGWILWLAASAMAWSIAGDDYVAISLSTAAGPLPATTTVAWLAGLPFLPALIMIMIFVPLLFPTATCSRTGGGGSPRWGSSR